MNLQRINNTGRINTEALASYILSRKMDDGGFTFCYPLPSSLPETFYALYILKHIGFEVGREAIEFIKERIKKELYSIYYSYNALTLLGEELPDMSDFLHMRINEAVNRGKSKEISTEIGTTASYSFDVPNILREVYLAAHSLRLSGEKIPSGIRSFVEQFRKDDGGYGVVCSNLEETYYCVSILNGRIEGKKELIDHILSYECNSGGFNQTPHSYPPYIEETYFALSSLRLLGKKYRNKKTSSYICSLQNPDGGFRRSIHGGISSLEFSYYAVASLRCMDISLNK